MWRRVEINDQGTENRGDGYLNYLDIGDGTQVYTCINAKQIVHLKYVQFIIWHLYLNKTIKANIDKFLEKRTDFI